jgi:hypothetical protein
MQMKRQHSGAHQQTYPDFAVQNRVIGLRAVAAAVRYQGNTTNAERSLAREIPLPEADAMRPQIAKHVPANES